MNDVGIREAINYFNGELRADDITEIHQKPLVALATRYLALGGVCEEYDLSGFTEGHGRGSEDHIFMIGKCEGRRDTLLAVMGREGK